MTGRTESLQPNANGVAISRRAAWPGANFQLIDKNTEIAPGVHLISLVSNKPGTLELRELSLALNSPHGAVIVVGCSHPGIDKIVETATAIDPRIHFVAGGFHLVVSNDGELTFSALKQAFADRYLYAGLGTVFALGATPRSASSAGPNDVARLDEDDLESDRAFALTTPRLAADAHSVRWPVRGPRDTPQDGARWNVLGPIVAVLGGFMAFCAAGAMLAFRSMVHRYPELSETGPLPRAAAALPAPLGEVVRFLSHHFLAAAAVQLGLGVMSDAIAVRRSRAPRRATAASARGR